MSNLPELRVEIDKIDAKLVELLNARAEVVLKVKEAKKAGSISVYSPARERAILDRAVELSSGGAFPDKSLEVIFTEIVSATRSLIGELKVAHLGEAGGPSYLASIKLFGEAVKVSNLPSIEEAFLGLEKEKSDFCVFPVQSEKSGINWDLLKELQASSFFVIAEVSLDFSGEINRFFVVGRKEQTGSSLPKRDKTVLVSKVKADEGDIRSLAEGKNISISQMATRDDGSVFLEVNSHVTTSEFKDLESKLSNDLGFVTIGCFPGVS